MREIFISSIIMRVAAAAPRLHQISRFIMIFSVVMGQIMAETPTTISRLKMFEPITLLKAMSLLPESPAEMLTAASGALVPMATMVSPIITDGTLSSFATDEARNKVYNVAFGQRTTLNELFDLIREEVVRHMPEAATATATHRDFRAGDVRHSLADITRARTLLGYEPQFDVRTGLRLAGDWYAANL